MAPPVKKPCAGCKSTVEVLQARADDARADIRAMAAQLAELALRVNGKLGEVTLPSGYKVTKTPADRQATLLPDVMHDTPEAQDMAPVESITGYLRKR